MEIAKRIRTVTELKARTSQFLNEVNEAKAPLVITQEGVARGVLMDVGSYDRLKRSLALLRLVAQGEEDVRAGRTRKTADVFARLSKKYGLNLDHEV